MNLWERIAGFFASNAQQLLWLWLPDGEAEGALRPRQDYFELWLTHSFLKREVSWLKTRYPAAHVSVRMNVAGETRTLTRLARPSEGMVGPGVWANFPVTGPIPYQGGTVEIEAGLTTLEQSSMLGAAVEVLGDFSGLVTPPLSEALRIADRVAVGVQKLLDAGGGDIVLGLHHAYGPPGSGQNELAPGHLAIIGASAGELTASRLVVEGSRIHRLDQDGSSSRALEGYDYLLLGVKSISERSDWEFPRFEKLIQDAIKAHFAGETVSFKRHRDDVLAEVLNSPDLTEPDRERVATAILAKLELATEVSNRSDMGPLPTLTEIVETYGLPPDVAGTGGRLSLADLTRD